MIEKKSLTSPLIWPPFSHELEGKNQLELRISYCKVLVLIIMQYSYESYNYCTLHASDMKRGRNNKRLLCEQMFSTTTPKRYLTLSWRFPCRRPDMILPEKIAKCTSHDATTCTIISFLLKIYIWFGYTVRHCRSHNWDSRNFSRK